MSSKRINVTLDQLTPFRRDFFGSGETMAYIGTGSIGGKASGLAAIKDTIAARFSDGGFPGITVTIPKFVVIATDFFDEFVSQNDLLHVAQSDMSDEYIAHAFGMAELPEALKADLRILSAAVNCPLAIRSSSLLEDALYEPFAGVYETKMIPNNQRDPDSRFEKLIEAIKFVYASTFFVTAKDYQKASGQSTSDEKMAVIIQEVHGQRHNDRFYPDLSGVTRSYNFYPSGKANPEEGVVDLAIGLGKSIVDGDLVWNYSPAYPRAYPPVGSPGELLKLTQTRFWAINMGRPPVSNPIAETEYLCEGSLNDSEQDGTLKYVASTYRSQDDKIVMGIGASGPRIVTFAPLLVADLLPINDLIKELLKVCEETLNNKVEIEFAMTLDSKGQLSGHFGFLQVRPMVVSSVIIDLTPEEMTGKNVLLSSDKALGNGIGTTIEDIVYVDPDIFEAKHTQKIAGEISKINRQLVDDGRHYLLIGFGRWGSSDSWLGIPVKWGQISGAKALVEVTLPNMNVELSQGAHFFHNLTSFQICYFAVHYSGNHTIDWDWLKAQEIETQTEFVRHIRLKRPLVTKVDGRSRWGVVLI